MDKLFDEIHDNIFENLICGDQIQVNQGANEDTTTDSMPVIKSKNDLLKTETKYSRVSKIKLNESENKISIEKKDDEYQKNANDFDDDEYSDYGRIDKTGIHFQIISDFNVSIEVVPDNLLPQEAKDLIIKYKGVFDTTMKMWIVPYINYEPLYKDLLQISNIKNKLHKIGSIARECLEHKELTTLIIKRKKEDEKIEYTDDNMKRSADQLPDRIKNALYFYQKEGIQFGIEHHCRFLLADEMGLGKTLQAISLAYIYRDSWPVLIICPGSMKYLWRGEIMNWLGLKDMRINIINSAKQRISSEAYFYIISYDLVRNILKKLKDMNFDFVILDEAHSIKNRESLRARNILPIAVRAKRLILITGTPILAKPYEGYPLLYALRPDLFMYFKKYAYRYCDPQPTPCGMTWSGTSNTKELHWILSTLMVRRLKREVLNQLPPKRRQKVFISTDEKIIKEINFIRSQFKGRKGTLDAYTLTGKAKLNGVYEYLSDLLEAQEKFIVFAYHYEMLQCIENLMKEKKVGYIRIDGNTKQEKRYDYVNEFQKNNNCRVAILSIIAASTGITLTSSNIVIFAELTWTPSIMIQAEDRAHRIGQNKEFVDIKYLYGKETLDDFILDRLQKKLTIVSTTIDDKQEYLGVKADPKLIGISKKKGQGTTSKDLIAFDKGDINIFCEDDEKDIEKMMMNDLGSDEKQEKNKKIKKNKKKRKKYHRIFESSDSSDNDNKDSFSDKESESEVIAVLKEVLKDGEGGETEEKIEKKYPPRYPKQKKSRTNFTDGEKKNVSKLSGIKKLKKIWNSNNNKTKSKSIIKCPKTKNEIPKCIFDSIDNTSKKSIFTFFQSNKKEEIKQKLDDDIINNNKNILSEKKPKEEYKEGDKNCIDKKDDFKIFEDMLMVNLHKSNIRRTFSKKDNMNSFGEIDIKEKKVFETPLKESLLPLNKNIFSQCKNDENKNEENIVENINDKIPLI